MRKVIKDVINETEYETPCYLADPDSIKYIKAAFDKWYALDPKLQWPEWDEHTINEVLEKHDDELCCGC